MSKLILIGLIGLAFVILISIITVLAGGHAIYTAPFSFPFAVCILIGLTRKK
ncbi:MAG TPA: hypothetical protein VNZ86_01040 [Bacteroidia bacterium]|jgi:hypothetical protein|nr:hypothetical protein [Bacteroidia bacterium]